MKIQNKQKLKIKQKIFLNQHLIKIKTWKNLDSFIINLKQNQKYQKNLMKKLDSSGLMVNQMKKTIFLNLRFKWMKLQRTFLSLLQTFPKKMKLKKLSYCGIVQLLTLSKCLVHLNLMKYHLENQTRFYIYGLIHQLSCSSCFSLN